MSTFEITIERKAEEGWPAVVERTSPGAALRLHAEGVLTLGADEEHALRAAIAPQEYGDVPGQALFRDQLRNSSTSRRQ